MKQVIYCGAKSPVILIGKHQVNLGLFANQFRGWHSYKTDRTTTRAVIALEKKGYLEHSKETTQFRWKE